MKTILVVFTDVKLKEEDWYLLDKYAFNTQAMELTKGTLFEPLGYSGSAQVVKEFDKTFNYVNRSTGELSVESTNSHDLAIKELRLLQATDFKVVYCNLVNEEE